jgi:putative spermidine/putrescine transport system substrate-binding protein
MKRLLIALFALALGFPAQALAQDKLVVSIWGGSWRDLVAETAAKKFTQETGVTVEFITGGTIDRLNKAKLSKAIGATSLYERTYRLALQANEARPRQDHEHEKSCRRSQDQPLSSRQLGLRLHDRLSRRLIKGIRFDSWADLWKPELKASLRRDFDRATSLP